MIDALRLRLFTGSRSGSRLRAVAGLAIMLAAIGQSAAPVQDSGRLAAIAGLSVVMSIAWFVELSRGRRSVYGVWLLGGSACVLMLLAPGTGPVIGAIAALVTAGSRLTPRAGALVAVVLGFVFVAADAWQARGTSNLLGGGFTPP